MDIQKLKWRELEKACQFSMERYEKLGLATMSRYGVQGTYREQEQSDGSKSNAWAPVQSLPDFEGVLPPVGRQFILECKVLSGPSLALHKSKVAKRQIDHMLTRARFGAVCLLVVHFNSREMKKGTRLAQTYAFPVHPEHPFWVAFESAETKTITRIDCEEYATEIAWEIPAGCRSVRPNLLEAIHGVALLIDDHGKYNLSTALAVGVCAAEMA